MRRLIILCACAVGLFWGPSARAQQMAAPPDDVAALKAEVQELRRQMVEQRRLHQEQMMALQGRIEELSARTPAIGSPVTRPASEGRDELDGVMRQMREDVRARTEKATWLEMGRAIQTFNPDLSVIGDFVGHYDSREGGHLDDKWLVREVELGLSGTVDPYLRADVFLGIHRAHEHHEHDEEEAHSHGGEYELHIEEAYVTTLSLPHDLQAKVGKFKAAFGKANPQHLHALPWVEYPLMIRNYFGEEGMSGEGLSLSWLVPNPWNKYIELTYETFNNDGDALFAGEEADDFVHLAHLKTFWDLSPSSSFEVGISAATAPNNAGHGGQRTWVEGLDVTYKWRPPREGLHKSFQWQTELLAAQKELEADRVCSWGMFTALEYQFARRWAVGGRYDCSQTPDDAGRREHAWSAYLTFFQSEYCLWRLGYQYSQRNFEVCGQDSDQQVFLQLSFGLGPHRAHKY